MTTHDHKGDSASDEIMVNPLFGRQSAHAIPRWRIPDDEMLPETAYQIRVLPTKSIDLRPL